MEFHELPALVRQAIFVAAFLLVGMSVTALIKRTRLVDLRAETGRTMYGGIVLTLAVLAALAPIAVVIAGLWEWEYTEPQLGMWIVLLVLFLAAAAVLVPCTLARWRWDEKGIEYQDPFHEELILWSEITGASTNSYNLWQVEAPGRRKIAWSRYTIGWDKINEAVALYRPDLVSSLDFAKRRSV